MNHPKRLLYNAFIGAIRAYQRPFLDLDVWGLERIPPGPKIYVQNHITSTDPYWVLPLLPEPVHVIIGPGYQSRALGCLLHYLEQINAMPEYRKTVVDEAVKYLRRGESIYTAPEGDIQEPLQLGHFYPGVAKIYREIQVPIIPIGLHAPRSAMKEHPRFEFVVEGRVYRCVLVMRGPYCIHIGEPFLPRLDGGDEQADNERIMNELRERMRRLIEDIRLRKGWA